MAKKAKNDEFYTLLPDIEKELYHYRNQFDGKTLLCNCDDPEYSNFWKYFAMHFKDLGLQKLISTHYNADGSPSYMQEVDAATTTYDQWNMPSFTRTELAGDGDFRSDECIELLKQADIVVTNPPFSCFREYVAQLMEYGKQFLVLGNENAITYKEIFPLLKDNKIWLGYYNGAHEFLVPSDYEQNNIRVGSDGQKYAKMGNIAWYTNLDVSKRHEELDLVKKYYGHEDEYPTYDNYDAINVDKTVNIPADYDGVMGVPITFLDEYNPEQFEILDARDFTQKESLKHKSTFLIKDADSAIGGKAKYARIVVRHK